MSDRARVGLLVFFLFAGTCILLVKLFSVSIIQHKDYIAKAEDQQNVERDILPRRGAVYVQDFTTGKPTIVAQSVERYALSLTPRNVENKTEYAALLANLSGTDEGALRTTLEKDGWYMDPIMHGLKKEDVERVAQAINDLEKKLGNRSKDIKVNFDAAQGDIIYYLGGTYFVREYQRVYPEGQLLGHVLGFVNDKGKGQYGFEAQYDQELKGYSGRLRLEKDSTGNLLRQSQAVEGRDGTNYELSIDRNLQFVVEQELAKQVQDSEAQGGSVVIMDPKTGEIMAMANTPSYDPNNFREAAKQGLAVFDNPSISSMWEPGSIFKPLVMSMALDLNLVTPQSKENLGASIVVDGYEINNALLKGYGESTMTDILVHSDNPGMVTVSNKIGNANMYEYLRKYGFGVATGIDLKNEATGRVTSLNQWRNIHRATQAFGQGISVTPVQIATAYSAIANNGKMLRPRVVHAIVKPDGTRQEIEPSEGEQVVTENTAQQIRDMMTAVVDRNHRNRITVKGKVAGKTGTAQIPNPDGGGYLDDVHEHAFISMAPSHDPRFVMLVKISRPNKEKGLFAESHAVPLANKLLNFLFTYYQIPPDN